MKTEMLCYSPGRPLLRHPGPGLPNPVQTVENGKSLCQFVALQEGTKKASPLHSQECKTCFLSEMRQICP